MEQLDEGEKSVLREFVNTSAGKKLLMLIVNQELNLLAKGYSEKASLELQGQVVNKVAGIYWVRTLIKDLTDIK